MIQRITFILLLISVSLSGQTIKSDVGFADYKTLILMAKKEAMKATGKLASGEIVSVGCEQGTCFFEIDYRGRKVRQIVGDDITQLTIYQFDFGGDGDLELVVVNEFKGTAYLYIYSYSRGIILKIFEKEVKSDKVNIKKDYIEYYLPAGLDTVWHYYNGEFWTMAPLK